MAPRTANHASKVRPHSAGGVHSSLVILAFSRTALPSLYCKMATASNRPRIDQHGQHSVQILSQVVAANQKGQHRTQNVCSRRKASSTKPTIFMRQSANVRATIRVGPSGSAQRPPHTSSPSTDHSNYSKCPAPVHSTKWHGRTKSESQRQMSARGRWSQVGKHWLGMIIPKHHITCTMPSRN